MSFSLAFDLLRQPTTVMRYSIEDDVALSENGSASASAALPPAPKRLKVEVNNESAHMPLDAAMDIIFSLMPPMPPTMLPLITSMVQSTMPIEISMKTAMHASVAPDLPSQHVLHPIDNTQPAAINDLFACAICHNNYFSHAFTSCCMNSVCGKCIDDMMRSSYQQRRHSTRLSRSSRTLSCPYCRKTVRLSDVKKLTSMSEQADSTPLHVDACVTHTVITTEEVGGELASEE